MKGWRHRGGGGEGEGGGGCAHYSGSCNPQVYEGHVGLPTSSAQKERLGDNLV